MYMQAVIDIETKAAEAGAARVQAAVAGIRREMDTAVSPAAQSVLRSLEAQPRGQGNAADPSAPAAGEQQVASMRLAQGGMTALRGSMQLARGDATGLGEAILGIGRAVGGVKTSMAGMAFLWGAQIGTMLDQAFDFSGQIATLFTPVSLTADTAVLAAEASDLRAQRERMDAADRERIAGLGLDPRARSYSDEDYARIQALGVRAQRFNAPDQDAYLRETDPDALNDRIASRERRRVSLRDRRSGILESTAESEQEAAREIALAAAGDDAARKLSILDDALARIAAARDELRGATDTDAELLAPGAEKALESLAKVEGQYNRLKRERDLLAARPGDVETPEEPATPDPGFRLALASADRLSRIGLLMGGSEAAVDHGRRTALNTDRMARGIDALVAASRVPHATPAAVWAS